MNHTLAKPPRPRPRQPESFLRTLPGAPALVYRLQLDEAPPPSTLLPLLTPQERARAARFAAPRLAAPFAAGRWGLRLAIANALGLEPGAVPLSWDTRGRPLLVDAPLFVSASSAGGLG